MSRDITAAVSVLRHEVDVNVGKELPDEERESVKVVAGAVLVLLERLLLDLNRAADALEVLAKKS
jgi:hypothetical protein